MQNGRHAVKRLLVFAAVTFLPGAVRLPAQQPPAATTPTPAPARRPPQARTQPEFKDYNTAYAVTGGSAMEKAASDFEQKYPSSELRAYLYAKAMHEYQTENNSGKMLAMGERVLKLDPDNVVALVLTATVLSDDLSDTDQDKTEKIAEIKKNARRALETVDTSLTAGPGNTAEQITAYKNTLRSMAHSALAITDLKTGDNSGAEKEFRIAADLTQAQPDPYVWYHLALAQDHQGKYPEALASVTQALEYTGSNAELSKLATGERERLLQLTATPSGDARPQPSPSPPPL
jgi:tetratricopeptide (TPR) repeat protein